MSSSMRLWKSTCRASSPPAISPAFPIPWPEVALRVEHWVVAEQQGQVVAANMLGGRERYDHAPFFWSQHYELPIRYVGHAGKWDTIEVIGDLKARDALIKYLRGGQVVAVASIHRDQDSLRVELDLENSASAPTP